jgi:hypothetical protein
MAGCQMQTPGRTLYLGDVSYEAAYAAARDVVAQYYPIAAESAEKGEIRCHPAPVEPPPERLLGRSPARHLTTARIRRKSDGVWAQVAVAIQRQGRDVHRHMRAAAVNYDGVPNEPPGRQEAATTPQQNEAWVTQGYAHDVETRILDDLYKALHPDQAGDSRSEAP